MIENSDLRLFCNYRRLKEIERCNNFPKLGHYDVAQHSFYVTLLCMFVGDEFNAYEKDLPFCSDTVNMEILLKKAMLHDTEESITSDIPWNIKHSSESLHAAIEKAVEDKVHALYEDSSDVAKSYEELCNTCKQDLEGQIVGAADMVELALYCTEEYKRGNVYIEGLLLKCIRLFPCNPIHEKLMTESQMYKSIVDFIVRYKDSDVGNILYVE